MRRRIAILALCATGCVDRAEVSLEAAQRVALANVPGVVRRTELAREHGRLIWELRIAPADDPAGTIVEEIEIDADTGEVIDVEDEPFQ